MTSHTRLIGIAFAALTASAGAQSLPCVRQSPDTSSTNTRFIGRDAHLEVDTTHRSGNLGPFEAFGIVALDLPAFEERKWPDRPPEYSFLAEPVVARVTKTSLLKPGDVIEAVDDHPITTSAGSRQFTYPSPGANTLTVRRGRERVVLRFDVVAPPPCTEWTTPPSGFGVQGRRGGNVNFDSAQVGQGRARGSIRIRGQSSVDGSRAPVFVIDGVTIEPADVPPDAQFGFALSCKPTCAKVTGLDGRSFYKFDAAPVVSAVLANRPAATAGLKVGDVLVKVDGLSILADDGAIRLSQSAQRPSLGLTVQRDGKEMVIQLQVPR